MAEETRVAILSILVDSDESVEPLNALLHDYRRYIFGRMGLPYRQKDVCVICVALDATGDVINSLAGKIGRLPGVTAKTITTAH